MYVAREKKWLIMVDLNGPCLFPAYSKGQRDHTPKVDSERSVGTLLEPHQVAYGYWWWMYHRYLGDLWARLEGAVEVGRPLWTQKAGKWASRRTNGHGQRWKDPVSNTEYSYYQIQDTVSHVSRLGREGVVRNPDFIVMKWRFKSAVRHTIKIEYTEYGRQMLRRSGGQQSRICS